jgi:hypothetical protein
LPQSEKNIFPDAGGFAFTPRRKEMTDFDSQIANRKPVIVFFAFISAFSTMAAAVAPFVAYA